MREEEAGDEDVPGLPEAAEDLADEMAVAALSRTLTMREDNPAGKNLANEMAVAALSDIISF